MKSEIDPQGNNLDRKDTLPLIETVRKKSYNIKNEKKIQVTLFGYKTSVMEGEEV